MKPKTLQQAVLYFSDPSNCVDYMAFQRWPDGVVTCPTCGRKDVSYLANQRKWQCKSAHKNRQFSAKVGTIFEDSPIPLEKWLVVVWMLTNCKNGVSSYEIAKTIGVTQKSAWFMLHRIRLGLSNPTFGSKIGGGEGGVEVDESFVGGKARNMHRSRAKKSNPVQTGENDAGQFAKFENFMKRLVRVPHEEIKAALDAEKKVKKRKRASRAASDKG